MNKLRRMWSLSLLVNGLSASTIAFFKMIELEIPHVLSGILAIAMLIASPILIYTTFKLYILNKKK